MKQHCEMSKKNTVDVVYSVRLGALRTFVELFLIFIIIITMIMVILFSSYGTGHKSTFCCRQWRIIII